MNKVHWIAKWKPHIALCGRRVKPKDVKPFGFRDAKYQCKQCRKRVLRGEHRK